MIGGVIAARISPSILADLARNTRCVIVTGTNGKSTTTRMVRTALAAEPPSCSTAGAPDVAAVNAAVASNTNGDNLPSGVTAALMAQPNAPFAALEVDEMHVPAVAAQVRPAAFVLLNLSRDQLDRVGEIGAVEQRLRQAVAENPDAVVVANCDDPLIVSAAMDAPKVVWVSTGGRWNSDSVSFPRGGRVVRDADQNSTPGGADSVGGTASAGSAASAVGASSWHVVNDEGDIIVTRPEPAWWCENINAEGSTARATLRGPFGVELPLDLSLPGQVNLGNAAQAVAAAVALGIHPEDAVAAVSTVSEVAGRYSTHSVDGREIRIMLAKNPAGWQESMAMCDPAAQQVVIGVNGQIPDGQDLSWLWDVDFSALRGRSRVVACGERGADLAVRLQYAGIDCQVAPLPMDALALCEPGQVEMLLNYTSLRDFKKILDAREAQA
ncbi:DUF1727 domain-containing protein [Schaalia canis]|uniref:Lipid II isoglutaminyl synthase (glutamine-hydrolyzing) subunit MurT n=2 Tax=Schaalia canis TaxID=100469 RepID=A0A3P1SCR3_9ACTO|nr:DUF1727 domain-containing protein [Schaalia canis]